MHRDPQPIIDRWLSQILDCAHAQGKTPTTYRLPNMHRPVFCLGYKK